MPTIELERHSAAAAAITISVEIDYAVVLAFRREAARRDTTVARLVHDLLETIADDNLVGAVLDA